MDWQDQLISLYLLVCKHYQENLSGYCERRSRYVDLQFSDEEAITLYLYGIIEGMHNIKSIHRYAGKHLSDWFIHLPGYVAFDQRINQIHDVFMPLVDLLSSELVSSPNFPSAVGITDAMPIIMAQRGRRFNAKVAPEIATKNGYCATKNLYYYGVKLHVVGYQEKGTLPKPVCIGLTDAGMNDRKAFEQILPFLPQSMTQCFADKAYQIKNKPIHTEHQTTLFTPVKKEKKQMYLDAADRELPMNLGK